ncbi:MAG TPA: ATP-binding protein, partial [Tepidiformaceae bacterium]|nr:ATP-binding protein [Tepidiformaceae bacterium]
EAARIFERFYRSDRTAKLASGAGLGLAVCKRLVEAMDGEVWARPRDGGGLEVGFRLPAYRMEGEVE